MLDSPIIQLALAAAAVVLMLMLVLRARGKGGGKPGVDADIERLIRAQRFGEAARLSVDREELAQALELYLRAQQPANAANVAARMGDLRQAAELYERGGNLERAAHFYEKAGNGPKAEELRKKLDPGRGKPAPGKIADAEDSGGRGLEAQWRSAAARSDGSAAGKAELQRAARAAADALLAEGELRRAADVYRDAELDDEAIHLYVNVLGDPGQAAPIVGRRGNHERAAELYELAGQRERAAASWVTVAQASPRPDQFFERIEQLSPPVAVGYFEKEISTRKLSADNAGLYYFLARALAATGETERARGQFAEILQQVGDYEDIKKRMSSLGFAETPTPSKAEAKPDVGRQSTVPVLSESELEQLASQVAHAAAEHLRRHDLASLMSSSSSSSGAGIRVNRTDLAVAGLELAPLRVELLYDEAVAAARVGPSIDTLNRFIAGPCDLQNIEVYFRVGLAHLAAGDWDKALVAFDAVEDASPGYRDAWKRADEIRGWKQALGGRGTRLGDAASVGGTKGEGRYQLRGELGRGGMAVVYRGFDSVLGREVALKFLSEELSAQADMREMFQREARAVAALNHPNIVTIHDVGVLEERAFICMEFVDGRSIENLISESPGLTIVESLRVIKQVLDALGYAHDRQIIHRDIKPANMMRTSAGLVKLMDFGLAKSTGERKKTSFIAGTPSYMAPEHMRGEELDVRADLFAIAVTLYEMLTGALPYEGLDRSRPPLPLEERVPAAPPRLSELVMRGLELDRSRRWGSAQEMVAPIEQILDAVSKFAGGGAVAALLAEPSATAPTYVPAGPTVAFGGPATAPVPPSSTSKQTEKL